MLLDAAAAKALAALILVSTRGIDSLKPQLPLQVIDRGEDWLVKGTPYTDQLRQTNYNAFWIFFRKTSAEVVGIGWNSRAMPTGELLRQLQPVMKLTNTRPDLGPITSWEPGGPSFPMWLDMTCALYGGLINTPADAVAYSHVLMGTKPALASVPEGVLVAEEHDKVWHVTATGHPGEIMSFSRIDGKMLSGDL